MLSSLRRWLCLLPLCIILLPAVPVAEGYEAGDGFQKDLSIWIRDPERREYVEMMVDYYIRTDSMIQNALQGGFAAVFLFDGCSDNMNDDVLADLTYYRVSGVCLVIKLDENGNPRMIYFNDNCSTLPDKPLAYGSWSLPEVGEVGPATVCDGTYQLYSVYHRGQYEALHVRTEYTDPKVNAVYMIPGGFVPSRATEINVHTRTSNHVAGKGVWSAGCLLVGGGENWEFRRLIYTVYDTAFDTFETENFVGTLTIDRQKLRQWMYTLYENPNAVDYALANSRKVQPETYLRSCTEEDSFLLGKSMRVLRKTQWMSLPCSNQTDARSLNWATLEPGEELTVTGSFRNTQGSLWYAVKMDGKTGYVYASDLEEWSWLSRLRQWLM